MFPSRLPKRLPGLKSWGIVLLLSFWCIGWGPHPAITQAALDVLGTNDSLMLLLGPQAQRLTNYCWLPDFKRLPFREPDQDFYADDYLLFPQSPTHLDHLCPEVKKAYVPYFRRALQALRTESPANAARWVGALLHFLEDTGSPPHAAEIRGPVHIKMENWVDAGKIHITPYRPQLLGINDVSALEGFLRRMDGLIEFSKSRGKRLLMPVLIGRRSAVEPVVLESALETSRVSADLLYTLGNLARMNQKPETSAGLNITVLTTNGPAMEKVPARIVFHGTNISSLADASGRFQFYHLPVGSNRVSIFRPGTAGTNLVIDLKAGETNTLRIDLSQQPRNLIRNGDFQLNWVSPGTPDCWQKTSLGWEGEIIPLKPGVTYRLVAKFKPDAAGDVLVRWTKQLPYTLPQDVKLPKIESRPLTVKHPELVFTGNETMALMQISIRSRKSPGEVCESVVLLPVKDSVTR
ncbi:MAG TPA: hypothetical protein VMZ27_09820 [Candidatus Saccharimonadales bacterium]|nr:hypothetical protein [Candidatus Saccharimonadales bacterium]